MADRNVVGSNTFEQFRVEFNELATDVGDIASITGASGTIASATDVIEAVVQINNALDAADLDGAGDSGTFAVDLDTQSLTIAGTTNEIETVASGQTLTIGLPNNVTISGNATIGGNIVKTGDLTVDVSGDITLDADGGDVFLKDGGVEFGRFVNSSDRNLVVQNTNADKDVSIIGNDNGSSFTAFTLDMSEEGKAIFNKDIQLNNSGVISNGSVNLSFPTVGGAISTEGFSIALATALG